MARYSRSDMAAR